MSDDPLDGLPADLVRALRDPSIVVPQDQAVFELVAEMTHAPSATASAMTNEQWMKAWVAERERAVRAEQTLEGLESVRRCNHPCPADGELCDLWPGHEGPHVNATENTEWKNRG